MQYGTVYIYIMRALYDMQLYKDACSRVITEWPAKVIIKQLLIT